MDRDTVYSFYKLSYDMRLRIMKQIGIPLPECTLLGENIMFNAMLKRAEAEGKWEELQKAIKEAT